MSKMTKTLLAIMIVGMIAQVALLAMEWAEHQEKYQASQDEMINHLVKRIEKLETPLAETQE
jgi:hypothetical protein